MNYSQLSLAAALLLTISFTGCVSSKEAIEKSAADKAKADLVGQAIEAGRPIDVKIPLLPIECGEREFSGIKSGMTEARMALLSAAALGRANSKIIRCYELDNLLKNPSTAPTPTPRPIMEGR